jgi:flagellar protein FliT
MVGMMNSTDLIAMYERIAKLSSEMVIAARTSNWDALTQLEDACADQTRMIEQGASTELSTESRQRKVALLKQILANDRMIRDITEPWLAQAESTMRSISKQPAPQYA